MMLAAQQPLAKVPSEEIYVTLEKCLDNACAREVESLRATRGLSHESSAVMSCVFDDLKAKVMGGIRQNTTVDPTSTIAEPMNEEQLREHVALLKRKVEDKHAELLVLRDTVPAKVRESCAKQMEAQRPKPSEAAAPSSQDLELGMDVEALSTRVESTTADLKELKETLTGQASKLQATMKVLNQELGQRGGGKMNAKAAAAVAATSDASGTSRMKERNRSGRHAPY